MGQGLIHNQDHPVVIRNVGQSSLHVAEENLLVVGIGEGLIDQLTIGYFFAGNQGRGPISLIFGIKFGHLSRTQSPGLCTAQRLDTWFFVYADDTNILLAIIPGSQV